MRKLKRFTDMDNERTRALYEFEHYAPFFALQKERTFLTDEVSTLAVDRHGVVYVNGDFWYNSQFEHRVGYLVHESQHPMRLHFARAEALGIDPRLANIVQDMEINDGRKLRKFLPRTGIIYPHQFGFPPGLCFEEYWELWKKKSDGKPQPPENGTPGAANGDCGSGASGEPKSYELPAPSEGGPGMDETTMDIARRTAAENIAEAESRNPGSIGGSSLRWAQDFLAPPKIDWRSRLKANARNFRNWKRGHQTTNYSRPSRRNYMPQKIVRPRKIDPIPSIAILVDTSGSMGDVGPTVLSEVQGCLKASAGHGGTVLVCDARMHGIKKVKNVHGIDFIGGGGTDMRIGIEAASLLKPRPEYLVILSDGYSPWPTTPPPHMRVIIALVGAHKARVETLPSWATVIDVPTTD